MLDAFLIRLPILPIDTGRYGSPEMRHIFDEESKLQKWLDVEAAVAEAEASVGDIPRVARKKIARTPTIKPLRWPGRKEVEKETRHDLMSMVMALTEACKGEGKKYVHYGLTSMDVEDTTTALQFKEGFDIIEKQLDQLETTLASMVRKYRSLLMVARTHGRHAGVITFGLKLAVWLSEIKRQKRRLRQVRERALVGKILGIVGTGAGLGKNALKIQEKALSRLGLKPAGLVTQVIQRDIHAEVVAYLALLGSSLDKFATEIRNLQRSEISEALEPFERKKQVGSSALRSKRNPELSERVSSLAKLLRGLTIPALENIPLWHERDLSNSANERFLFPMSFILTDEMLRLEHQVLKGLEVMPRSMERNLELSQGAVLAERVVNMLVEKGVARQDAHERVRKISMKSIDTGAPFVKTLGDDAFVSKRLRPGEIKAALDYTSYLGVASQLINMALNE